MDSSSLSRRDLLRTGAAALVGSCLGIGGWEAVQSWRRSGQSSDDRPSQDPGTVDRVASAPRAINPPAAVIDVHFHAVRANLTGRPGDDEPEQDPREGTLEEVAARIRAEMQAAKVVQALCMPTRDFAGRDALGVDGTRQLAAKVPGLHPIGIADPERFDEAHLAQAEESLQRGDIVALKAYLGYLHHGPDSPGYQPYYKLAAKYKIPVIFHTGDTYSNYAKVRFAHPLPIDDVAVDHPETNFVLAHLGNPWLMDAAELIYKNNKHGERANVWADLSGLVVGTADDFATYRQQGALDSVIADVRKAIEFSERPDRFLFGSDWPLAPLAVYRDFILDVVPQPLHQAVFYENAKALFRLDVARG